jgi:hypothetical protein
MTKKSTVKDVAIPLERIQQAIYLLRGQKVILDRELAELYGVETKRLKEQVRRNLERFPEDFMFVLDRDEFANWRSQFATSKSDQKGLRHPPMAFTEQGVAMLSSVLRSERAIEVNIAIMRTFVKLRQMLESHEELARKLENMEKKYDEQLRLVFDVLGELMAEPTDKKRRIGFGVKESRAKYKTRKRKSNSV